MAENFETLISQLQAAGAAQRSEAALQLGKLRDARAVDALVAVLCTEGNLNVREDTTWALVRMGDAALDPLLLALAHDDPQARQYVAHVLGKIADARAVDALVVATNDTEQAVRYKAVQALGQVGETQALGALVARLDDPVLEVQWLARDVLAGFGTAAVPLLIGALEAETPNVRELAASLLGDIGDPQAVEPLLAVTADPAWEVRLAAVQALGQIGDRRALAVIEGLGADDDPRIRAMAKVVAQALASV